MIAKVLAKGNEAIQFLVNPLRGAIMLTFEEYAECRRNLITAAESLNAGLLQAGLKPTPLSGDDVLRRLYRKNNPQKFESGLNPATYNTDDGIPVSEYFLASPMDGHDRKNRVPKGMLYLDGYYHKILTLKMPPGRMSFPHLEVLGLLSGLQSMDIVVNLTSSSMEHRVHALQSEKTAIEANEKHGTKGTKLQQIDQELQELGSGESKIFQAQHLFILRDRDPERLNKAVLSLQSVGQRAEETEIVEEIHALFPYWIASQPGWARDQDLNRHNIYNTRQITAMLPCFGGGGLNPSAPTGAVFPTADGSMFNIYPHDMTEFSIPNLLILGKSGSGKSVLTNTIMTQIARRDPRIIMVDIGRSYRRLCESMGGNFIEYDIRSADCCINPFDVFTARSADVEEIQAVILLLGKMVAEKPGAELTGAERAALEDALQTIVRAKQGKVFYLHDFRDALQGFGGNRIAQTLAIRLSSYVGIGTYAKLFDGPTKVPTGARMTVFELAKLRDVAPELLPVAFQTVLQHVVSLANNYPDDVKVLAMDEAHVLLDDPEIRKFVQLAYRTFRKLGVAVIGISQGIHDWLLDGSSKGIIENVSGILACQMSSKAVEAMVQTFDLSPNERDNLTQLQMIPGEYSEFMAIRYTAETRKATICVNRLSPIEYAMYTTHSEDIALINRWQRDPYLNTLTQAVERFAEKYPQGVVRAGGLAPEDQPLAA
jgi:conjugal transfer ATP-binding protein TraC